LETLSWIFDSITGLVPFTGFKGMLNWVETLVNDCVDIAGPFESMFIPPSPFVPSSTNLCTFSLYPLLSHFANNLGYLTELPMQMPPQRGQMKKSSFRTHWPHAYPLKEQNRNDSHKPDRN
jgi:hypothetical protein